MDAYRLVGEDDLARHHALEVLRLGTAPDGAEKAPMRMAEARLTLGAVTARTGELEQAVDVALTAFPARRRSLPQLLMIARAVGAELRNRDPGGRASAEFGEAVRSVSDGKQRVRGGQRTLSITRGGREATATGAAGVTPIGIEVRRRRAPPSHASLPPLPRRTRRHVRRRRRARVVPTPSRTHRPGHRRGRPAVNPESARIAIPAQ